MPEWRDYLGFLCVPWKLCIFVPAFCFVTFAGRYTNDETWDAVTGSGMSALTFLSAPWSVGLLYQIADSERQAADALHRRSAGLAVLFQ